MRQTPAYRADIDGLRAVAVLAVIGFHAFAQRAHGGYAGVDVFFVISGYLIGSIVISGCLQDKFSFADFYARRIRRIFPALALVLAACLGVGWVILLPDDYAQLGKYVAGGAGFSSNFVSQAEDGYFDSLAEFKPLLHLWSLGIEEQFYILFPVAVFMASKRRWLVLPLLMGVTALTYASYVSSKDIGADFYSPVARIWELLLGTLLSYVSIGTSLRAKRYMLFDHALSLIGMACILFGIFAFAHEDANPDWRCFIAVWGTLCLIAAGPGALVNRYVLAAKLPVAIGRISYPLYLWHWPLLVLPGINALRPLAVDERMMALGLCFVLAWGTARFVERPLRFGGHNRLKVHGLCAAMFLLGAAGYLTYHEQGFVKRFPPEIRHLSGLAVDATAQWRFHSCLLEGYDLQQHGFAPECTDMSKRPMLVLWGDSHAAALYPGFKKLAKEHNLAVSQYSVPGCPPLLGYTLPDRTYCAALYEGVVKQIGVMQPDYVILHARWDDRFRYDLSKLANTVAALRQVYMGKIVVIGPVPVWSEWLPRAIWRYWRQHPLHELPPRYMTFELSPKNASNDAAMRALTLNLGIDYISAYDRLCNEDGCLTRIGDGVNQISMLDEDHLSPAGAEYLIEATGDYFLKPAQAGAP